MNKHTKSKHESGIALHSDDRPGRPRIVGFACPKCGENALVCNRTQKQEFLIVRYYRCKACGHHGVLASGSRRDWWKDSGQLARIKEKFGNGCM